MKYDDFGRPIYETAEEYNRAHKSGGTHLYNTVEEPKKQRTATERHAMRTGSKKAKKLIVALVVCILAINVGIAFTVFSSLGGFSGVDYEDWIQFEDEDGYDEYIGDTSTPLPVGFETFSYNGQLIYLPTTYEELSKLNFVLDAEYDASDMVPSGFGEWIDLVDADGNVVAMISVDNYTDDEIPLGKCTVDYFSVSNPYIYDETQEAPEVMLVGGLTFQSTYEDFESVLGIPYYHYEDHSEEGYYYDSYEWTYYGDYQTQHINVTFWNGEVSDVSIQNSIDEEIY